MKTEGRNAVFELLKTGKNIEKIMLEKKPQGSLKSIFAEKRKKNIKVQFVFSKIKMDTIIIKNRKTFED